MALVTLRDLYVAELQDLLDAEQHELAELPRLARAATSPDLRDLLDRHASQTQVHVERLELLLRKLAPRGDAAPCDAMHGIIREARRRIDVGERGDVLDAALIGVAQRIEHYEVAVYGCARSYATTLGDSEAVTLLDQTLEEEAEMDERLTKIAKGGVNEAAGEDLTSDADAQRRRLRYVPASHLAEFKYRAFRVRNAANEDLGSLDGLILDARSQRAEYVVIDSGGWFVGQRFVLPIDAVRPDESSQTLRTDLDRPTIETYPPFNPDSYLTPSGEPGTAEYPPPTWLMTGVWMTEASGFASVPPRAQADFAAPSDEDASPGQPEERDPWRPPERS